MRHRQGDAAAAAAAADTATDAEAVRRRRVVVVSIPPRVGNWISAFEMRKTQR